MAPKRRSAGARNASASQQATLSFHGKQNKITKPSTTQQGKEVKKDPALTEEIAVANAPHEVAVEQERPTAAEKVIEQQAQHEAAPDPLETSDEQVTATDVLGGLANLSDGGAVGGRGDGWVGEEEQRARKTSEAQIRKYWRRKEEERLAPRVHQQDLTIDEKVLREWDMSGQYGPCIGIARLKRWKRANLLGLHPPIEVLAVLLKDIDAGETKSQRAHVDELLSSRFVET
nr:dna polymerase delta subunit 4 [Quercus suber]